MRLVLLLGGLTAFGPFTIDAYLPAFPRNATDLGTSAGAVQLTLTAALAGLAFGQLVVGPLSDRWGRRPPLLIGGVAYTSASLACAFAPSVRVLTGLRREQGDVRRDVRDQRTWGRQAAPQRCSAPCSSSSGPWRRR